MVIKNLDKKTCYEIRGNDYKYLESALLKAIAPKQMIVYHGVEYMETEFYERLKLYIQQTNSGYDYQKCVGKQLNHMDLYQLACHLK